MTNGILKRTGLLTSGRKSLFGLLPLFAAGIAAISTLSAAATTPAGWQTTKDSSGVCQISLPPSWSMTPGSPGQFASPDHLLSVLGSGSNRSAAPMTDTEKQESGADKIIENSAQRWLYAGKPTRQNVITYHVNVPTSRRTCAAELAVKVGYSEDEIKKIAATVGPAN
jgi:hypothetical protein